MLNDFQERSSRVTYVGAVNTHTMNFHRTLVDGRRYRRPVPQCWSAINQHTLSQHPVCNCDRQSFKDAAGVAQNDMKHISKQVSEFMFAQQFLQPKLSRRRYASVS